MIEVATQTVIERKIDSLIRQAWDFGKACEVDCIRQFNECGDSHIEFLRDKLEEAKDELFQLMVKEIGAE